MAETIYDFITTQRTKYAKPIDLDEGWHWNMKEHLRRSFLYLNSQFEEKNDDRVLRPNKNIVSAILNIQYRTEGFDVKDIELFVDNKDEYYKSALARKFHHKWALENKIDTFIDDMVYSYADYGGALIKNTGDKRPMVVDLRTIEFCNQTDLLNNPFCIKHSYSASQLREMKGWGDGANGATISVEELIVLAKKEEKDEIEIFEVHGVMPKEWLQDSYNEIDEEAMDVQQIQIVAYYKNQSSQDVGVTLFKGKEPDLDKVFKFLKRDKIDGRALGRGGVEELFEPQVWTNWNEIKITEMLEAASKTILMTDDPSIMAKHPSGLKGVDNLEFIETVQGAKGVWQMDTFPRNLEKFNQSVIDWQEHAQEKGSASDPSLGKTPSAGTPFKSLEAQIIEGKGIHTFRQGQIATFMDELYRDWILPHIGKEIVADSSFLAEFSADEIMGLSEQVSKNRANKMLVERVLNGKVIAPGEKELIMEDTKNDFIKGGNKKFIDILKEDFKDLSLAVNTNIVGKQKNLALMTDKVVNIVRQYLATPELRQDPEMAKLLNVVLESSGLSPIMFNAAPMPQAPQQGGGSTEPLKDLTKVKQQQL